MRRLMILLSVAVLYCHCAAQQPVSKNATTIYKAFLAHYYGSLHATINIADRTVAFDPGFDEKAATSCLKELGIPIGSSTERPILDASILPNGLTAHFIDRENENHSLQDPADASRRGGAVDEAVKRGFAAGVLALSEIVFNDDHTQAVLSFSFHCGRLCGNGGAMLFKMQHGHWSQGKQVCGGWVS